MPVHQNPLRRGSAETMANASPLSENEQQISARSQTHSSAISMLVIRCDEPLDLGPHPSPNPGERVGHPPRPARPFEFAQGRRPTLPRSALTRRPERADAAIMRPAGTPALHRGRRASSTSVVEREARAEARRDSVRFHRPESRCSHRRSEKQIPRPKRPRDDSPEDLPGRRDPSSLPRAGAPALPRSTLTRSP